jgi:hypothetical protein
MWSSRPSAQSLSAQVSRAVAAEEFSCKGLGFKLISSCRGEKMPDSSEKQCEFVLWQAQALSVIERVDHMPGTEFERFVLRLLKHRGYTTRRVGRSGDGGVNLIAEKGGERYSIQCRRYQGHISSRAVSDAVGGLRQYDCSRAMVLTNSYLTAQAQQVARANACVVVDRDTILAWLADFCRDESPGLVADGDADGVIPSEFPLPPSGATTEWLLHYLDTEDKYYDLGNSWKLFATRWYGPMRYKIDALSSRPDREEVEWLIAIGCKRARFAGILLPAEGTAEALGKLIQRKPILAVRRRETGVIWR